MQKTMQSKCAVFRTEKTLKEGVDQIRRPYEGMNDISVKDKSLLFNTDLVETLEFDNLISQALTTCLLYTSPSPRDLWISRMPSSA